MLQHYHIAGLTVAMDVSGRTERQAQPYLANKTGKPDIEIHVNLHAVQAQMPYLSPEDCEYLATGDSFYRQLLSFNGMMLHASAVAMDGRAYLFSAPCGTGKSTHATLWQSVFGAERAIVLNDDKPALRWDGVQFLACGTPWSGKTDTSANLCVPLAGVCFLSRGMHNSIRPYAGTSAIHDLLEQTVRPSEPRLVGQLLAILDRLLTHVPVWQLTCNMNSDAALCAYQAMSQGKVVDLP